MASTEKEREMEGERERYLSHHTHTEAHSRAVYRALNYLPSFPFPLLPPSSLPPSPHFPLLLPLEFTGSDLNCDPNMRTPIFTTGELLPRTRPTPS